MFRKTIFVLLLFVGLKVFSQDSTKTITGYAIVEISRDGGYDDEQVVAYYEDGSTDTLTDKLFYSTAIFFKNFPTADKKKDYKIPLPKKALLCIKYMEGKSYSLASSMITNSIYWLLSSGLKVYSYQYIFRRGNK